MRVIVALTVLALSGCAASPSADVLKALAGDPNSICWTIASPWGQSMFDRNHGCPGNSAPASTPIVVVTPGSITPTHVEVIKP